MRLNRMLVATAAAVAIAASGCGDSPAEPRAATGPGPVVGDFMAAFAAGDAGTACSLMTPAAQTRAAHEVGAAGCPAALQVALGRLTATQRATLGRFHVGAVTVSGATAIVRSTARGDDPVTVRRVGGRWLVDLYA